MKRKATAPPVDLFAEQRFQENLSQFSLVELRLKDLIPWELFREKLSAVRADYSRGGRPPYDEVLMFKCLVLQTLYNLSDEALEVEIYNRASFRIFLGMNIASDVPDRNTIWKFRERLANKGLTESLFEEFNAFLSNKGLIVKRGTIIDATFVDAPRQQTTPEEYQAIKSGKSCDEVFEGRNSHVKSHKDMDARWGYKGRETHYGYKNHVRATIDNKFIINYHVTPSNESDINVLLKLLPPKAEKKKSLIYADSAYSSAEEIKELCKRRFKPRICEKGSRYKKLTKRQRRSNRRKSRTRCRIEHIFGDMSIRAKGLTVQTVGIVRAATKIGLINLSYNMRRFVTILTDKKKEMKGKRQAALCQ